jgi:hypothetical protein
MITITDDQRGTQGMNKLLTLCKLPQGFHVDVKLLFVKSSPV